MNNNVEILIQKITKTVQFTFKEDSIVPGLIIAYLPASNTFYVSLVRYLDRHKKVLFSTNNANLESAIIDICGMFINSLSVNDNPISDLKNYLLQSRKPQINSDKTNDEWNRILREREQGKDFYG